MTFPNHPGRSGRAWLPVRGERRGLLLPAEGEASGPHHPRNLLGMMPTLALGSSLCPLPLPPKSTA